MLLTRGITKTKNIYRLVKSDRINALRKQYDAFLEEDKKRKERNEFILGRLDKMRYSTALVPVRQKPSTLDSRQAVVNYMRYRQETPPIREFQSSLINKNQLFPDIQNNEDTCLIQEISKKYILIPKLRSSFMNNHLQNVTFNQNAEEVQEMQPVRDTNHRNQNHIGESKPVTDNTDWKTKYEILNILKNEEKEKQTCLSHRGYENISDPNVNKSFLENNNEKLAFNYNSNINSDVQTGKTKTCASESPEKDFAADEQNALKCNDEYYSPTCASESPEKDFAADEQNALKCNDEYYSPSDIVHGNLIPKQNSYAENKLMPTSNEGQVDALDCKLQNIKLDAPQLLSIEVTNYETQPEEHVIIPSTNAGVCVEQIIETNREVVNDKNDYAVEVDSTIHEHKVPVPEQPKPTYLDQSVYLDEDEVSPIQILNPDGLVDINEANSTHNVETVIVPLENPEEITGHIKEFEAEQNMFYSEEVDKQVDPSYNLDYSDNVYQQQTQGYGFEANQNSNYGVGIQDEETTQRYESNYEEQYGRSDEGLEQQPYQEIERVHLNQKQLIHHPYEQHFENPEQIEESLDVEDRYIPQQPEAEDVEIQQKAEAVEIQQKAETMEKQYIEETAESEKPDAEKASEQIHNKQY